VNIFDFFLWLDDEIRSAIINIQTDFIEMLCDVLDFVAKLKGIKS
jgi:hypothetical protein